MNNHNSIDLTKSPSVVRHKRAISDASAMNYQNHQAYSGVNTSKNSLRNSFFIEKGKGLNDSVMNNTQANFGFATLHGSPMSPDKGQKYDVSVSDVVNSNLKRSPFGIEYYSPPKMERAYLLGPKNAKMEKSKLSNFADLEAKNKAFVPGPSHYSTATDWSKMIKGNSGKFLKSQRLTLPMEIMKNKEKGTPSPGQYENTEVWRKFEP
jgi:hypothetical protein